jgi:hypothetical protein
MTAPASRLFAAVALAALVAGATAACGTGPDDASSASPSASPSPSSSSTSSPAPTGTAAPVPQSAPIDVACDELVTPQAIYDYNPNFGLDKGFTPASGSFAGEIEAAGGLVCSWLNQTSGDSITVAVAQLPDEALTTLKSGFVTTSTAVPAYGAPPVEGYFQVAGASGEAQVFSGPYWVNAVSASFYEPGDAQPIVAAALAALPQ